MTWKSEKYDIGRKLYFPAHSNKQKFTEKNKPTKWNKAKKNSFKNPNICIHNLKKCTEYRNEKIEKWYKIIQKQHINANWKEVNSTCNPLIWNLCEYLTIIWPSILNAELVSHLTENTTTVLCWSFRFETFRASKFWLAREHFTGHLESRKFPRKFTALAASWRAVRVKAGIF